MFYTLQNSVHSDRAGLFVCRKRTIYCPFAFACFGAAGVLNHFKIDEQIQIAMGLRRTVSGGSDAQGFVRFGIDGTGSHVARKTNRFNLVGGEITNLRAQSSGHIYFTLKDESAQLNCVLFSREKVPHRELLADARKFIARRRDVMRRRAISNSSCAP